MSTTLATLPQIEYRRVNLEDIDLSVDRSRQTKAKVTMRVEDQPVQYTDRFSTSLAVNLGFAKSIFNLFDPDEVFDRITKRSGIKTVTVALDTQPNGVVRALGTSMSPLVPVDIDTLERLHKVCEPVERSYHDGVVKSTYALKMGRQLNVKGNDFHANFVLETPIDGFGPASSFLGLLRLVCANGLVAMAPAFRTKLHLSNTDDNVKLLRRFCETFSSDDGFDVLGQRLQAASQSPTSLDEIFKLHNILSRHQEHSVLMEVESALSSSLQRYGIMSLSALSEKQRRVCPTNHSVYDLINLATEAATHKVEPRCASALHGFVGGMISSQYDLEGTMTMNEEPADLFLNN